MAAEVGATRRRIIHRPRLTKLLDESPARIKLLVAPAGYGKTTLAQQWLSVPERRDVWYRGDPASADVAALAAGIAIAVSEIVPDAGKRMRQRMGSVGHPEEDMELLAELLAEDVDEWPLDAWLAIDDYHFAMDSATSERLVEFLAVETSLQMLLTTRTRPSWASARRILYGEIQEIDRRTLSMEKSEALEVLGGGSDTGTAALVQRARGWPAVLGLAAQAGERQLPSDDLPDQLYDYFAEELFRNAEKPVLEALHRLALMPSLTIDVAQLLLGDSTNTIVDACVRLGAVTVAGEDIVLHPLLRTFLVKRLAREDPQDLHAIASKSAELLISLRDWDAAFHLIAQHSVTELLEPLVTEAVEDLLAQGRTQTLVNWLALAEERHLSAASLELAEAEVAFRQARFAKAETLAAQAAVGGEATLAPRMLVRAGQAAVMDSRDEKALEYFRAAKDVAKSGVDRVEAAVGLCFAALELGLTDEAGAALAELSTMHIQGIDVATRKAIAQLVHSSRVGGLAAALDVGAAILPLLDDVRNPLVATSFLNCYGHLLSTAAYYEDALAVSDRHITTAEQYRLAFAVPHGYLVRAAAYCGLRDFAKARAEVARAEERGASNDIHVSMDAAAVRARLALCRGDAEAALSHASRRWERAASRPMMAEYLAYRALSHACLGEPEKSTTLSWEARRLHGSTVETLTLTSCAEAIAAVVTADENATQLAKNAYGVVRSTGGFDALVVAGRACPGLLQRIATQEDSLDTLGAMLSRANDFRLGRQIGLHLSGSPIGPVAQLTERELEVADLVAHGHTNRAIADRLFISESTVKVHVRHILRKLNASKRAEIAARVTPR
jgi:ATP/maltotriose-dependent transcriptional regulator MalT